MFKKIVYLIVLNSFAFLGLLGIASADDEEWTKRWDGGDPTEILQDEELIEWDEESMLSTWWIQSEVQDTAIDDAEWEGVMGTLESVGESIWPYIDWAVYIWLTVAVILLIYNGIYLIINSRNEWALGEIKKRILYIWGGLFLVLGFYLVLQLITSLIANIV